MQALSCRKRLAHTLSACPSPWFEQAADGQAATPSFENSVVANNELQNHFPSTECAVYHEGPLPRATPLFEFMSQAEISLAV